MRRAFAVLAAILALALASPAEADVARPVVERRLANGLRAVICPDPKAVETSVVLRIDAGVADEPARLDGLARIAERLMFGGSKHAPRGKHVELLERAGGTSIRGVTSFDATIFHETVPPERLELALWLESDRLGYLVDVLDDASLARARNEVEEQQRGWVRSVPLSAVPALDLARLFPAWHPYHRAPVGSPWPLSGVLRADALAFFDTWYGAANAAVIIAGKVEPAAALRLVERYFGALPARRPPARPQLPPLPPSQPMTLEVGAAAPAEVRLTWATSPAGSEADAALDVVAALLAGSGVGRLHRALAAASPLCATITAGQRSMRLASIFEIRCVLAPGRSPEQVVAESRAVLLTFEEGVPEEELRRAKRSLRNVHLFALESSLGWALHLADAAGRGPLPASFDGDLARHDRVRAGEVRTAVRTELAARPPVVVIARPRRGAPLAGVLLDTKAGAP